MLKGTLTLEQACGLMSYVNGDLADTSDDLINDAELYFMFVRLAAGARHIGGTEAWDDAMAQALRSYREPVPGARERVEKALRIMLNTWISNRMRQQVEDMLKELV